MSGQIPPLLTGGGAGGIGVSVGTGWGISLGTGWGVSLGTGWGVIVTVGTSVFDGAS